MDLDPRNFLNLLHQYLQDNNTGPEQCDRLFSNLNDILTQEQLNLSNLDLYLQYMFNKSRGLPYFVTNVANKKKFKSCVVKALEIIFTLINNFPLKLERYVITIHELCVKIIKSSLASSDEKVKSLEVLILSFEQIDKCLENPEHYNEVYDCLRNSVSIKKSDSAQEKIFRALGTFAKKFQYLVKNSEDLKILFLTHLEMQMIQKDLSYKMISGLFTALDQFCESYPFDSSTKEDEVIVGKLYRYIDKMSIPTATIKVANRAALTFLANHISLFVSLMIEKFKHWHYSLLRWLTYGPEDRKVGVLVLGAFYQGLGDFLVKDVGLKYKNVTLHFMEYFKRVVKTSEILSYEKRLCLQGLCSFSVVYQKHLNDNEIKDLYILISHNFEQTYVLSQEYSSDVLEYLPDSIQTIAKLMCLKKITNSELFCLQKGIINMIKSFHQLPYSCHSNVIDALVSTFHYLKSNDEKIFNSFVEITVYQGVVWTCSHQHISEVEILEEKTETIITVKNYLSLWKGLLKISPVRRYDKSGIYLHDRNYILVKVIDKLVRTMLILINKLNVAIVLTEVDVPLTDIESAYKVAEVNDFAIFLNVVDLYEEVFAEIEPTILKNCICKLIQHLILKCVKYPLISGFYKLLSFCLRICNKINYFDEANVKSVQDIKICYQSLTKFIEILLVKTKQFKGDLLIACLQVLLEYPTLVIRQMLPVCIPSFRIIFYVGRSYVRLADMAIDTLIHWQNEIESEEMESFLIEVLPLLDSYLQSKSLGGLGQTSTEKRRKTSQMLKKRKILVEIEPELIKLQKRILHFIGQQNSSLCQAFVVSENSIDLAVWGDQQHLKVSLPYEEIKLDIYLDKLLPRIINLALYSIDRKTRIVACELLQAIIMVFLGTTKQMTQSGLSDLNELLRHIAFPLLKLGCDLDKVVEQLFKPLFFQLIHWYTHTTQFRSDHSSIIIEAVMEGITHPTDSALRDFSGKCVNEFVKWTIKQTNEKNLARDPLNIKVLLKKMRFNSVHPDPCKKLGAALIFNNIYRDVREESSLLSMFWIEFLHIFVKSLSMIENDADHENAIIQINNALSHIQRGFIEKSALFNKSDGNRRIPIDIKGDLLKDVSIWLLAQTGSKSSFCREKCIELFCNITPYTKGYQSLQRFITQYVNKETVWITETYLSFLLKYPTLDCLADNTNINPIKWMQLFLCALDGYNFIVQNNLVSCATILNEVFVNVTRYFVSKISSNTIALIQPKTWISTTFEKQDFDKQKSQAILKLFQLFNALLNNKTFSENVNVFYTPDLWNLVLNMIFNRQSLGFEPITSCEDDTQLISLLENFMKKLPEDKILELVNILHCYIANNCFTNVDFKSHVELKQRNIAKGLNILQLFNLNHFNLQQFNDGLVSVLLDKYITSAEGERICADELQDTTLSYCLSVLDFALTNENEFRTLIDFLYKPYQVQTIDCSDVHFGTYVLTLFEDSVIPKIMEEFEIFLDLSLHKYNMLHNTVELIIHVLNYMANRKQFRNISEYVVKNLLSKWECFEKHFNESFENVETGIDFVKQLLPLLKLCKINDHNLKKWLNSLLVYEKNLSGKNELDVKIEVFYLLVDIMDAADDENIDFRSGLMYMKNKFFSDVSLLPLEVKIVSLDKLFCATTKIKIPELLTFLLDIYVRISTESSNTDLKTVLSDYIMKSADYIQEKTLLKIYEMCRCEDMDGFQKYKLIMNITSLFQYCSVSVFENFFVENICKMISTLQGTINQFNVTEKILHFMLLELLFLRCPINSVDAEISPITQAALPDNPNNKRLLLQLLKFTLDIFKDSVEITPEFDELFRLYKCHGYNAMVSIVSNSMKDANFYMKLFIRQENNADILWKSLVDTKKSYIFEADFDTIPKRRKILINIRDEVRARKKLENTDLQTVKYAESMRIYNSSLSEDITKFDFTNKIVRSQSENQETENVAHIQSEIELDCINVNTHESMATVCGLIEHMVRTGITELPEEDEDYSLPAWIKGIRSLLLSEETHANVKIFWVKVIDNTMHIFKHFAKWFLEPLLKFIVDKCAGNAINYFVTDVVSILASWSTDVVPSEESEIHLASELLIFLINHIDNERQDMFKYHLELIKLLIEAWKTSIQVPRDLIFAKLNVDATCRKVEIGIHLSSIVLANNITPWEDNNIQNFCKTLFHIVMKHKYRSVYKPCSETIGLLLRFINGQPYFSKIFGNLHVLLKKIEDPDKYAHILEAVVLHYPPIADEFHLNKLLSRIHAVPSDSKAIYMRIMLSRSDVMCEIDAFKTEKWDFYIENDNLEVQLLALEVVYKCLDVLRGSDRFKIFIESVCKHVSSQNILCRTRMYDIAIFICENNYCSDETNKYEEVFDLCKNVLIQGVIDNDIEIREKVIDFWQNRANLPVPISKRFSYMLTNLYRTDTESDFLGYSSYLLLDIIKHTTEYTNLLFEHPLEDCDFEDYYLQTNWRVRHLSVVPMFAETLRSFSEDLEDFSKSDMGKLRQTQTSLAFAPTQSVRIKQFSQFTMSESSLFIKPDPDNTFVNPNLVPISNKYKVPKRRFLRDKSKIHKQFAHQEIKKSVKKIEQRRDLAKERENKVSIYRTYRKGDLPDIQITLQAILEPLQALALYDGEISKILYLEIFKSILPKMSSDVDFMDRISTSVQYIFNNSIQFNRNLFQTLLDAILLSKNSIIVQPDLIATVCQSSGLVTLGILLLEEYLLCYDDEITDSKRTKGYEVKSEISYWVKLAELYKEMDEWDVVKSIFLEKMDCQDSIKEAVVAESRKQWRDAQELYKRLIETDETLERKDFYYESYFKCFAHLGEWDNLVKSIEVVVSSSESSSWNNLWDQDWNQRKLMPWYISGQLKNALFSQNSPSQFFLDLNKSLNSDNLEYLQNHFSEELAMLWISKGEVDEAEQYLQIYVDNFLDNWQLLDPLYSNLRYNKLLKLRNVIDIRKFVDVLHNLNVDSTTQLGDLISYWNRTSDDGLPSILFCEERVLYRRQFANLLERKIESFGDDLEHLVSQLQEVKFKFDEGIIDAAIEENNFYMTKKYLNTYKNKEILRLKLSLSKLAYVKSTMLNSSSQKLAVLVEATRILGPIFEDAEDRHLKISAYLRLFNNLDQISSLLMEDNQLFQDKKTDILEIIENSPISRPEDVALFGANKLKLFLNKCEDELNERMDYDNQNCELKEYTTISNAYVDLAYFAKKQGKEHFANFMLFVLRAMRFNSSEGRQLFPCILLEENFSEPNKTLFIEETEKIPLWMFLGWIPQLLVNIDSCKMSAVAPVVLRIAKTYPQAIMFAYRLSKENYNFKNDLSEQDAKKLIKKLDELLLSDARFDDFLKGLSSVGVPAAILLYYVKKMIKACQSNDTEQIKLIQQNVLNDVFNYKPDSRDVNCMQGNMFKKIEKYKKDFQSFTRLKNAEILKKVQKINAELVKTLEDSAETKKNSRLLKDYCPWLANFSANKINLDLEIPGQYDGKNMPLTQHHIKVAGFCVNVSVMSSLRKPIKITILGNDTKEYPFLIKFGEDVRQDQRIQQLFSLMNNIFGNDKSFNERECSILTYQVVPLTTNLGIIQWIDNTTSLQDFIKKPIKNTRSFDEIYGTYQKWIYKSGNHLAFDAYGRAAVNYSRDKTIPKFRSLVNLIPSDVLRSAFLKLSANTEGFSALRNNFIKSYAVMCVSHWILGVGDRHLSNSLICLTNGKVLGIDFGHAFGTATQILPVPELVPFRLTPHIVNLMEPLGERGLFRETMIHCLRSLRFNTNSLLATMYVFIEEPSLDWLEHAARFRDSNDSVNCEWYPAQKVQQTKRKLEGTNSTSIMIEDLIAGHQKNKTYMNAYVKLIKGLPDYDVRARKEDDHLSVEDQVDCLIDHATDYNLLGRMFEGWAAWV